MSKRSRRRKRPSRQKTKRPCRPKQKKLDKELPKQSRVADNSMVPSELPCDGTHKKVRGQLREKPNDDHLKHIKNQLSEEVKSTGFADDHRLDHAYVWGEFAGSSGHGLELATGLDESTKNDDAQNEVSTQKNISTEGATCTPNVMVDDVHACGETCSKKLSYNDIYRLKINAIEAKRKEDYRKLKMNIQSFEKRRTALIISLVTVWFFLCWLAKDLLCFVGVISLFLLVPIYLKLVSLVERHCQSDDGGTYLAQGKLHAQLSLAGSLHGTHRQLYDKSPESLGAMYEVYTGLQYESKAYDVEYRGLLRRRYDGGVDLVCTRDKERLFVQCKYWRRENKVDIDVVNRLHASLKEEEKQQANAGFNVKGVVMTSSTLTTRAKQAADQHGIEYVENNKLNQRGSISP